MLVEQQLFEKIDKLKQSIDIMKHFEPKEGYYLAFSGGKDSCVLKAVADLAGVKYDAHYSVTTIDPPELIRFIKKHHPDVKWEFPKIPLLMRMLDKGFWIRQIRWCCKEYKENGGEGRTTLVGVRAEESHKRSTYPFTDKIGDKFIVRPILKWTEKDVWEFIETMKLPYCELYDHGWDRVGCLFCPMSGKKMRARQVEMYPSFVKTFRKYFNKLWELKPNWGLQEKWKSGDEMFDWWIKESKESDRDEGCYTKKDLFYGD